MGDVGEKVTAFVAAIVGLATLALILSHGANTVGVLGSFFSGLSNLIAVAISPVTGATVQGQAGGLAGGSWATGGTGGGLVPATGGGGISLGGINLGGLGGLSGADQSLLSSIPNTGTNFIDTGTF